MATSAQKEAVAAVTSTASAAVAAGTSTAASGAVASLLSAAGISASVPVVGWITAGIAATAAGIIALVGGIKRGRLRKAEAVALAQKLGFEDAAAIPGFTVRALEMSPARLQRIGARLERRVSRERSGRTRWRSRLKLQLIGVVLAFQAIEATPQQTAAIVRPPPPSPTPYYLAAGGIVAVALVAIIAAQE